MRRLVVAMAAGLVLLMSGCGSLPTPTEAPAATEAPEGDALYAAGAEVHDPFSTGLHSVLMAVNEGTWTVQQRDYGVVPILCSDSGGFFFQAIRQSVPLNVDADELQQRASSALEALDLDVTTQVFGSGESEERAIVGVGGVFERATVSIRPATGSVLVTARSTCADGDPGALAELVFAQSTEPAPWRLVPATEGPASTPQFYFPPDGPLYYDEAGNPLDPQPVNGAPPEAPYAR